MHPRYTKYKSKTSIQFINCSSGAAGCQQPCSFCVPDPRSHREDAPPPVQPCRSKCPSRSSAAAHGSHGRPLRPAPRGPAHRALASRPAAAGTDQRPAPRLAVRRRRTREAPVPRGPVRRASPRRPPPEKEHTLDCTRKLGEGIRVILSLVFLQ